MLLDSNILIYAGKPEFSILRTEYITAQASVSIVSKIEVLGYHSLDASAKELLQKFFNVMNVIELSDDIATLAIFFANSVV